MVRHQKGPSNRILSVCTQRVSVSAAPLTEESKYKVECSEVARDNYSYVQTNIFKTAVPRLGYDRRYFTGVKYGI